MEVAGAVFHQVGKQRWRWRNPTAAARYAEVEEEESHFSRDVILVWEEPGGDFVFVQYMRHITIFREMKIYTR